MMDLNWKWDLESIEKDLDQFVLEKNVSISKKENFNLNEDQGMFFLVLHASKIKKRIFSSRQRLETLQNLAYVTQLHLKQFHKSFLSDSPVAKASRDLDTTTPTSESIASLLQKRAGEWSVRSLSFSLTMILHLD
jgi:hypothetical protein